MLRELSLFSGIGTSKLAFMLAGIETRCICYVEIEPYCQEIIKARIRDGLLDDAPIWDDIRTFRGEQFRGLADIITAGFPCQPFSTAGRRKGNADERNLWPETARVIGEVRPRFCLLENVPGLLSCGYALQVIGDLANMGYDAIWRIVGARDIGASHRRDRWWVLAYGKPEGLEERGGIARSDSKKRPPIERSGNELDHPECERQQRCAGGDASLPLCDRANNGIPFPAGTSLWPPGPADTDAWARVLAEHPELAPAIEPAIRGVVDGSPHRVDRLKALGNAWVPLQAAYAIRRLGAPSG